MSPNPDMEIDALFGEAIEHHRNGRISNAEQYYRAILTRESTHEGSLHYLGVIVHQQGNNAEANELLNQAVAANPDEPNYRSNLGTVQLALGRTEDAALSFEAAIQLKPDFAQAYSNLSGCLHQMSRFAEAELAAQKSVQLEPSNAEAQFHLGNALLSLGRPKEALTCALSAIGAQPGHALASALAGSALFTVGRVDESLQYFNRAVELNPDNPLIHMNRGNALLDQGQLEQAILACRRAVEIDSGLAVAHAIMGGAFKQQGQIPEAESSYRHAMAADPALDSAHSDLLFALQYDPDRSPRDILAEARNWNSRHAPGPSAPVTLADHKPLRIGYVSADLRNHSVGHFMASVLKNHDREQVEVFCYVNSNVEDDQTRNFQTWTSHWTNITSLDDDQAAETIRNDHIDVLVDLSGHTGGNRLPLFTRRLAPIQITYLGYPATTGLDALDYRLTDDIADPEGEGGQDYSERLVRLPYGFLCYTAPPDAPEPNRETSTLTFGSFNNAPKINRQVVTVWSRILNEIPDSRLLLKHRSFSDQATVERYQDMFAREGIDLERISVTGYVDSTGGHLAVYNKIDVALDTFPYNGTTTTAEALWMGVPVITMAGDRHAARVSASILTHAGLPELIASDIDEYVELAVNLARDQNRLRAYRAGLRDQLAGSPFMDGQAFTRSLEETYDRLWQQRRAEAQ